MSEPNTSTNDDFEENWKQFLGHDFGDVGDLDETPAGEDSSSGSSTEAATGGDETISGGNGEDTLPAGSETTPGLDSAADPASNSVSGGEGADNLGPTVDQALVAQMLGFGDTRTQPDGGAGGTGGSGSSPEPSRSGGETQQELYMPFKADFKLDPKVSAALFEAEDTETREQALVGLLAAFGNTLMVTMEERLKDHHYPAIVAAGGRVSSIVQGQEAIKNDFAQEFPELSEYGPAVRRAWEIVTNSLGADKPYTEETRNQIGNLAREGLSRMGIKLPPRKGQQQQQQQAPATQDKKPVAQTPFEAGASRPGGGGGDTGPGALVDELSQWS